MSFLKEIYEVTNLITTYSIKSYEITYLLENDLITYCGACNCYHTIDDLLDVESILKQWSLMLILGLND